MFICVGRHCVYGLVHYILEYLREIEIAFKKRKRKVFIDFSIHVIKKEVEDSD